MGTYVQGSMSLLQNLFCLSFLMIISKVKVNLFWIMQIIPDNQGLLKDLNICLCIHTSVLWEWNGKKNTEEIYLISLIYSLQILAIGHDGEQESKGSISTTETATSEETRLIRSTALGRLLSCIWAIAAGTILRSNINLHPANTILFHIKLISFI